MTSSASSIWKSRKGFGSFHSGDIELLIREQPMMSPPPAMKTMHAKYQEWFHTFLNTPQQQQQQWDQLQKRQQLFPLSLASSSSSSSSSQKQEQQWTFLNHGAFGASLKPFLLEANDWRLLCEQQPLQFFDRILLPCLAYSIASMAKFLNVPATELFPLANVTTGLNCIFQNIDWKEGDEIVCFSLTYGSTKKMLKAIATQHKVNLIIVDVPLPIENEESIVMALQQQLSSKTRLVVVDQITSNTALALPVLQLCQLIKEATQHKAIVVVDAAHSLLTQPTQLYQQGCHNHNGSSLSLSLSSVCDYWLTNGHKWLCLPKGAAYMWIHPRHHNNTKPLIISHGYEPTTTTTTTSTTTTSRLLSAFVWDGCRDYAAMLTTSSAIHFWQHQYPFVSDYNATTTTTTTEGLLLRKDGVNLVREENRRLLRQAVALLQDEWKQQQQQQQVAPLSFTTHSPMALVPLPHKVQGLNTQQNTTDDHAFTLQELLHHEYRVEVPIKCINGRLYVRLSAHCYNNISHYQHLAHVIRSLH